MLLFSTMTPEPAKKLLSSDAYRLGHVHRFRKIEATFDCFVLADEALRASETLSECGLAQAGLRPRLDEQLNDGAVVLVMAG